MGNTKEKTKGFVKEFKEFITKGNVVDMAVGIIIGGAFTSIVNSLVNDVAMPLIAKLTGGVDFTDLNIVLREAAAEGEAPLTLAIGSFIMNVVNFILIALCVFLMIKAMNKFRRKKEEAPETTKKCTYCYSIIPIEAVKCPCCTSDLK